MCSLFFKPDLIKMLFNMIYVTKHGLAFCIDRLTTPLHILTALYGPKGDFFLFFFFKPLDEATLGKIGRSDVFK